MTDQSARASLILIGNELLDGRVQDVHTKYLCDVLNACNITTRLVMLIPDDGDITEYIKNTARQSDLLIVAGGLGPTSDDLTRESVAEAAGVELRFVSEIYDSLLERFKGTMAESNRKQALIPDGFEVLDNPRGTAPGFAGTIGKAFVVALPGPPAELRAMVDLHFSRLLSVRFHVSPNPKQRISTFLVPESRVEDLLRASAAPGVIWGTQVEPYRILVELRGGSEENIGETSKRFLKKIGPICGVKGDYLPNHLLFDDLVSNGLTFVAAESCTGGLIGTMLTDIPGSSSAVWGSFTTYANEAKTSVLSVSERILDEYGAVSRESVNAMCTGALRISTADVAVAVSGVAGPGGGTEQKPVGTVWIGAELSLHRGSETLSCARRFSFTGSRDLIRRRSAVAAILFARALIKGIDVDKKQPWAYI